MVSKKPKAKKLPVKGPGSKGGMTKSIRVSVDNYTWLFAEVKKMTQKDKNVKFTPNDVITTLRRAFGD